MDDIIRLGCVQGVEGQQIRIVVDGVTGTEGEWIRLPPRFPAALLTTDGTFEVRGVDDLVELPAGTYTLQPLAWWDPTTTPLPAPPVPGTVH